MTRIRAVLPSYPAQPASSTGLAAALPRLCALSLLVAGLGWAVDVQASDTPQLKPMKGPLAKDGAKPAKLEPDDPPPAAAAAAPPAIDPLETLRQRLAGRLTGAKVIEPVSGDLRVLIRPSAGASTPAAARAPGQAARPVALTRPGAGLHGGVASAGAGSGAGAGAGAGAAGLANWSYQGPAGPQTWGGLKPGFTLCGSGQRQSPIDIRGGLAVDLDPVKFDYQSSRFGVVDNGHTVQANVAPGNVIEVSGRRFELVQFHFHRPSEERIDGRQFEMSLHLVHKDEQGRLAVVAVLMDKGPPQPGVQKVWNNLPLERHEESAARVALDLAELLPTDRRYYTYMGSLTTPPCTEGVQWVVMRSPVTMSPEQIELFARIYPMNARPLQQASGRRILQSQ